jgi:putative serine protease PepD
MGASAVACLLGAVVPLLTLSQAAVPTPNDMGRSVAPLVDSVKDAVVTIRSLKVITRAARSDPFTEMLREQFGLDGGRNPRQETQQGLGSGFIIDNRGTVYTNNHVVAGADEVQVVTSDGRVFAAKVEGSDPGTDVAVVRMTKPPGNLKTVKRGNSDKVRVGDYVLAIGNPLGLGQTVTMGIVSAKNRSIDDLIPLSDFIQTDAPINQGNSGGPLVNLDGQVVGINSAIETAGGQNAGSIGLGFAIPIDQARRVAQEIMDSGTATKPVLGVQGSVEATSDDGAQIAAVQPGSPAEAAGIRAGDVVTQVGDAQVADFADLMARIGSHAPGEQVTLTVTNGGAERTVNVTLGSQPD